MKGFGEYICGCTHFNQFSHMEIGGALGNPSRLLHLMGDDDNSV